MFIYFQRRIEKTMECSSYSFPKITGICKRRWQRHNLYLVLYTTSNVETITSKKAALTPMIKRLNWWIYLVTYAVPSIMHLISSECWRILEPFSSKFQSMFVSPVNSTTCKPRFLPKSLLITIAFPAISLRCALYTAQMTLWQCHLYCKEPLE